MRSRLFVLAALSAFTFTALAQQRATVENPPPPPAIAEPPAPVPAAESNRASPYVVRSSRVRHTGKHYFELVIDETKAARDLEAMVVARLTDGRGWMGSKYDLRPRDAESPLRKVVIGVAVDFDHGRVYRHRDGVWLGGAAPGSSNGIPVRPNTQLRAEIASTVRLEALVREGVIAANFGNAPFARGLPAGYDAFDASDEEDDAARALIGSAGILARGERVAGEQQAVWIRRYWEWVRSFPAAESPSNDKSGARCGAGQSGPVWFLTGSYDADRVQRQCDVPAGKILLVPLVNVLAQVNPGAQADCNRVLADVRRHATSITHLRLQTNGVAIEQPERLLQGTGCFNLRDASTGHTGLAAGAGYWAFVKPLKAGRHEISFGGRFPDDFAQDVRYVLNVR